MAKKTSGLYAIGDIHGMTKEMLINLEYQGVVNEAGDWDAGSGTLVQIGDLTDRGPDGYGVMRKLFELNKQAKKKKGKVHVTIGNHDVGFLNCAVFLTRRPELKKKLEAVAELTPVDGDPDKNKALKYAVLGAATNAILGYAQSNHPDPVGIDEADMPNETQELKVFRDQMSDMILNGMNMRDLMKVCEDADVLKWAVAMPAMVTVDGVLFQHCDSHRVYKYLERQAGDFEGTPMEKVNHATTMIMLNPSINLGYELWSVTTAGRYWEDNPQSIPAHIQYFAPGATKVAHGHTRLFGEFLPSEYANGQAVNLDVGLAYSPHHCGKTGRMVNLTEHAIAFRAKLPPVKRKPRKQKARS